MFHAISVSMYVTRHTVRLLEADLCGNEKDLSKFIMAVVVNSNSWAYILLIPVYYSQWYWRNEKMMLAKMPNFGNRSGWKIVFSEAERLLK